LLKKTLSFTFYAAFLALVSTHLFVEIHPRAVVPAGVKLMIAALAVALIFAATAIKVKYLSNGDDEKRASVRLALWLLFVYYLINVIVLLFFDAGFGRTTEVTMGYRRYFQTSTNFIPFKGIIDDLKYFTRFNRGYMIGMIAGNLAVFMPMALFVPALFKRMDSFPRFALLMVAIPVAVEGLQFLTMTGHCDIDDVILNSSGAILAYLVMRSKVVRGVLSKMYIL